jgi:hypothetical protein
LPSAADAVCCLFQQLHVAGPAVLPCLPAAALVFVLPLLHVFVFLLV